MNHTKEPWLYDVGDIYVPGKVICRICGWDVGEANARRIVACVNACAGIPTDELERIAKTRELINATNFMDLIEEVAKENDL